MLIRSTLLSAALLLAAGCNRNNNAPTPQNDRAPSNPAPTNETTTTTTPSSSPGTQSAPGVIDSAASNNNTGAAKPELLTDEQIAQITDDANTAEIDQAKVAEGKAKDPRVKKFAEQMVKHHSEAKDKQAKLNLKTASSNASKKLENDASHTLSSLKADNDASFDRDYIADQVSEHQKVLATINDQLLPDAKSADLKAYLNEIKPTVEMHLKSAQELQRKVAETASR